MHFESALLMTHFYYDVLKIFWDMTLKYNLIIRSCKVFHRLFLSLPKCRAEISFY